VALATTRGDRLFLSLLGSAYVLMAWIAVMGTPIWAGLAIAALWAAFVFWRV
jgi:predicted small integral membrane protein